MMNAVVLEVKVEETDRPREPNIQGVRHVKSARSVVRNIGGKGDEESTGEEKERDDIPEGTIEENTYSEQNPGGDPVRPDRTD